MRPTGITPTKMRINARSTTVARSRNAPNIAGQPTTPSPRRPANTSSRDYATNRHYAYEDEDQRPVHDRREKPQRTQYSGPAYNSIAAPAREYVEQRLCDQPALRLRR